MKAKPIHNASDFDLDVLSGDDDLFRWFLLTYLFGKPIQSQVVVDTWRLFVEAKEGSLILMIEQSRDEDELSKRLQKLYGIGPKVAEIFMRETEEFFARREEEW